MRLLITITGILTILANTCFSQSSDAYAMSLLEAEMRLFHATDDTLRQALLLDKIRIYTTADSINPQLQREIKRVRPALLSDSVRSDFFWNAAIISTLNQETYQAIHYLKAYEKIQTADSSISFRVLQYLNYEKYDTLRSADMYASLIREDSALQCLRCIAEARNFELKGKKWIGISSMIIPGSGMFIMGHPVKGATALVLNAATVIAVVSMVRGGLYLNAIGWGANLFGKFYMGNVKLTAKLAGDREKRKKNKPAFACGLQIQKVLEKYPLTFR